MSEMTDEDLGEVLCAVYVKASADTDWTDVAAKAREMLAPTPARDARTTDLDAILRQTALTESVRLYCAHKADGDVLMTAEVFLAFLRGDKLAEPR